jgi:hypothetical protein
MSPEGKVVEPRLFWCNAHGRRADHVNARGLPCCDPSLGGILLPCEVVDLTGEVEVVEDGEPPVLAIVVDDILANTHTEDKEPLLRAMKKRSAAISKANEVSQKVTGKDVAPAEIDWKAWEPILQKLVVLLITVAGTFAAGTAEKSAEGDLRATQSEVTDKVQTELALNAETENLSEAINYYTRREIVCDLAIESFSRHREDERDFGVLVECCHSEGELDGPH